MSIAPNIWPRYSFVQDSSTDGAADCYPDPKLCLPLSSWANLGCQVQVDGTVPLTLLGFEPSATSIIYLTPVAPDFPCSYDVELSIGGFSYTHHPVIADLFASYDTGSASPYVYLYLDYPLDSGSMDDVTTVNNTIAVPPGSCFKFALIWDVLAPGGALLQRHYYGCTNLFRRTHPDDAYTSAIAYINAQWNGSDYSGYSDAFDFHYTGPTASAPQKIELPLYLRDPKMENDQKVYTRSDGSIVKLFERKEEVYTLETDLIPYRWHKALDIALSHDTIWITNPNAVAFDPLNTATTFIKKDNYEIEYMKAPFSSFGKGSCKLINADPIHLINNNCG